MQEEGDRLSDDEIARREAERAAAEAAAIGGDPGPPDVRDPAARPVYEHGGGESEGFELAEEALRDAAEHGDVGGPADLDAPEPEAEPDPAIYGEADEFVSHDEAEENDRRSERR